MQQFRTIRTLEEDMEFLGIGTPKVKADIMSMMNEDIGINNLLFRELNEEKEQNDNELDVNNPAEKGMLSARLDAVKEELGRCKNPARRGQLAARKDDIENMLKKEKKEESTEREFKVDDEVYLPGHKKFGKITAIRVDGIYVVKDNDGVTHNVRLGSFDKASAFKDKKEESTEQSAEVLSESKESVKALTQDILGKMRSFEKGTKKTFEDLYPEMETEIWDAIDSKNIARMNAVLGKLDDLKPKTESTDLEEAKDNIAALRKIASAWHGGQFTAMYAFASSGGVNKGLAKEALQSAKEAEEQGKKRDAAALKKIAALEVKEESTDLEEALKVQRMKKMSSSKRAKARMGYRHKRAKISRSLKKLHKKSTWKRKHKKLVKAKKGRKAGTRKRFILAGIGKISNIAESLNKALLNIADKNLNNKDLIAAFENVSNVCAYLNKEVTPIVEEFKSEEFDVMTEWDELKDHEKEGKEVKPDDELTHVGEEWDDLDDHDEEGDEVEDTEEDEREYVGAEESLQTDMTNMQKDAQEIVGKLKEGKINNANAKAILAEMLTHIVESSKELSEEFESDLNESKPDIKKIATNIESEPKKLMMDYGLGKGQAKKIYELIATYKQADKEDKEKYEKQFNDFFAKRKEIQHSGQYEISSGAKLRDGTQHFDVYHWNKDGVMDKGFKSFKSKKDAEEYIKKQGDKGITEEFNYVGQDKIDDEDGTPEKADSNNGKYVGKGGEPKDQEGKPEKAQSNEYVGKGGSPKKETQKPESADSMAGQYVGTKGEPKKMSQNPTKVDSNAGQYVDAKGEPGEETDKPTKPQTGLKYVGESKGKLLWWDKNDGNGVIQDLENNKKFHIDDSVIDKKIIDKLRTGIEVNYEINKELDGSFAKNISLIESKTSKEDLKYVGKDKPKERNEKPEKADSNAGKYVDTKGEPEEETDKPSKTDSMKGKYVGEGKDTILNGKVRTYDAKKMSGKITGADGELYDIQLSTFEPKHEELGKKIKEGMPIKFKIAVPGESMAEIGTFSFGAESKEESKDIIVKEIIKNNAGMGIRGLAEKIGCEYSEAISLLSSMVESGELGFDGRNNLVVKE